MQYRGSRQIANDTRLKSFLDFYGSHPATGLEAHRIPLSQLEQFEKEEGGRKLMNQMVDKAIDKAIGKAIDAFGYAGKKYAEYLKGGLTIAKAGRDTRIELHLLEKRLAYFDTFAKALDAYQSEIRQFAVPAGFTLKDVIEIIAIRAQGAQFELANAFSLQRQQMRICAVVDKMDQDFAAIMAVIHEYQDFCEVLTLELQTRARAMCDRNDSNGKRKEGFGPWGELLARGMYDATGREMGLALTDKAPAQTISRALRSLHEYRNEWAKAGGRPVQHYSPLAAMRLESDIDHLADALRDFCC